MTDKIMLIPNNVKIGPRTFMVKFVDSLVDIEGTQRLNGHILFDKVVTDTGEYVITVDVSTTGISTATDYWAVIKIDSGLALVSQRLTMMHEIVHGIADYLDVDISEKEVSLMSNGITAMLMDNPDVVKMFDWEVN